MWREMAECAEGETVLVRREARYGARTEVYYTVGLVLRSGDLMYIVCDGTPVLMDDATHWFPLLDIRLPRPDLPCSFRPPN